MKQKLIIFVLIFSTIAILLGCGSVNTQKSQEQINLENMLAANWTSYSSGKTNFGGGVAMYVISPKGTYFLSTNMPGAGVNTHFRAASLTKTFTGAAIMLLNQRGKLNIDDHITDLIPGSTETYVPSTETFNIPYKDQITIKMLLKHRSGVFDVTNELIPTGEAVPYAGLYYPDYVIGLFGADHLYTFDELVSVDATSHLSYFAPDTDYHYSNTGFNLLGKIIERVSGQRYDQFVNDNLIVPNSLTQTTFPYLGDVVYPTSPYEVGYKYEANTLTETTKDNMSMNIAEGNAITTHSDLANWLRRLVKGESGLLPATVSLMTSEAGNSNAYGLGIARVIGLGYGHNGEHGGYLTSAYSDPNLDVTIVISASVVNKDDVTGELYCLIQSCWAAKNILGYSTAETF